MYGWGGRKGAEWGGDDDDSGVLGGLEGRQTTLGDEGCVGGGAGRGVQRASGV